MSKQKDSGVKGSDTKSFGLTEAYSVKTPEDNKELYRNWAKTYDASFAQQRGYNYPKHIAQVYQSYSRSSDLPILDVGAGTGLVAEELLKLSNIAIDAIDISPEMLQQSKAKNLYQNYIEADLSKKLALEDGTYGAVVSAGTFTHGHVGPQAFKELIRVAQTNALFCIGVNAQVFDDKGFGSALAGLQAGGLIGPLEFVKANYYQSAEDHHAKDIGYTVVFRKR
ncbi:MAG: putative TPR repeat methyltransferase [Cryomorphaceae bacterium]|jgi:predicted TPR repeat methyltransferase